MRLRAETRLARVRKNSLHSVLLFLQVMIPSGLVWLLRCTLERAPGLCRTLCREGIGVDGKLNHDSAWRHAVYIYVRKRDGQILQQGR